MKKMTLALLSLVTSTQLLMAEALPASKDPSIQDKADKQIKMQNQEVVKAVVKELSQKVPQSVDQFTTFTRIENKDLNLIYTYEINVKNKTDDEIRSEDRTRMKEAVVYGVCTRSKRFLESDISLTYLYRSAKSKEELFRFDINPETCTKIWGSLK